MKRLVVLIALLVSTFPLPLYADQSTDSRADRRVTVMTQNLYLGASLSRMVAARSFIELVAAVTTTFAVVQATDFPQRASALAQEIYAVQPDLIGLQEVTLWRSQFPADFSPAPDATTIEYDFLQILLDALAARGLRYAPVAIATTTDLEGPRLTPLGLQDIRFTDREVILARADVKTADLKLSNIGAGHFAANVVVNGIAGPIVVTRGWASVDAKIRGRTFRFISTHLMTPDFPGVQLAQAEELLQGPAHTELPVVLVGDFNSSADGSGTATYGKLLADGFVDAWSVARPGDPGFTCCQSENLRNAVSTFDGRIDLVLFRGDFEVDDVNVVGEEPADRTPSGLWPSDHAGVAATLTRPRSHR
jgi:endonuclease/exonuclease/phosphatase family metal-dependent hydrolase